MALLWRQTDARQGVIAADTIQGCLSGQQHYVGDYPLRIYVVKAVPRNDVPFDWLSRNDWISLCAKSDDEYWR